MFSIYHYLLGIFVTLLFGAYLMYKFAVRQYPSAFQCESLSKLIRYLSTVVETSWAKVNAKEVKICTNLDNFSKCVNSWYEESLSDSENENENCAEEILTKNKQDKNVQTDGIFIFGENDFHSINASNDFNWRLNRPTIPLSIDQKSCDRFSLRRIQSDQLLKQVRFLNERDLKAPLVICVEANSTHISGYLLNLRDKVCKFYVYGTNHLPWILKTNSNGWDTTEFKMKNLLFALLLWEHEILQTKKFSLYANCWAVNHPDCEYGKLASDFTEHFTSCENIIRVNSNSQVSRNRDTAVFARLMQPACELIHWNLSRFRKYIKDAYGIRQFQGTHSFMDDFTDAAKDEGYFARSFRYNFFLDKVNKNAEKWCEGEGCNKCYVYFSKVMDFKQDLSSESESNKSDSEIWPYPLKDGYW